MEAIAAAVELAHSLVLTTAPTVTHLPTAAPLPSLVEAPVLPMAIPMRMMNPSCIATVLIRAPAATLLRRITGPSSSPAPLSMEQGTVRTLWQSQEAQLLLPHTARTVPTVGTAVRALMDSHWQRLYLCTRAVACLRMEEVTQGRTLPLAPSSFPPRAATVIRSLVLTALAARVGTHMDTSSGNYLWTTLLVWNDALNIFSRP